MTKDELVAHDDVAVVRGPVTFPGAEQGRNGVGIRAGDLVRGASRRKDVEV